jgi:phosphatidylglycerol:prolipoprotein diacylglycerol transferase
MLDVLGANSGMVGVAAALAGLACAVWMARRDGLDARAMYWAGAIAILFGFWGARLLGMVYYGTDGQPLAWLRFWSGGTAQYGAFLGGGLAMLLFLAMRRLPPLAYFDAAAPAVALTVSIGRIACFLNGDDFGRLSHFGWAVRFPPGTEAYADHLARGWIAPGAAWSLPVHPIQLYESVVWFGLAIALAAWRPSRPGLCFGGLAVAHGAARFAEQFLRGDFQPILGPLSLTQWISLGFVALGLGLLFRGRRQAVRTEPLVGPASACQRPLAGVSFVP